jgi:ribosomal protein S27E
VSQPVGLDCPNCGKTIVASFDVTKDTEIRCSHCGSVIVAPRDGGKPFLKK